jgi:KUP system potassium uptake protein
VPHFEPYVLPIAIFLLIGLFMFQRFGTRRVSILFGPVMIIWFLTLAAAGISWIVQNPGVLKSFNPYYGVEFLIQHSGISLIVLGSVFLTVTGAEALYADLGHFGRKPIQTAWIMLIFPALTLNYLGQGALLLAKPEAIENPFFLLVPEWGLIPLICLATLATIIASQANITGAFSMTRQAIQLGLLPRMEIRHMSATHEGQIFMPKVNGFLLFAVLLLCLVFRNSSALASAYGIAVNGTMLVTSIVFMIVVSRVWKKGPVLAALIVLPFISLEIVFMTANMMKLFDGGYVPLLFAAFNVLLMITWVSGSRYLFRKARRHSISLADLVSILDNDPPHIIKGTAVFLTSDPQTAPEALMQNLKHNQVLHERNFILTVNTVPTPRVAEDQRLMIEVMSSRMTRIIANFGYMETPDVTRSLYQARWHGFDIDVEHVSFFLGRRNIISDPRRGLPGWQDKIYIALARSAVAATDFYRIPRSQVVELGIQMSV